jgi:hypothetical protein
MDPGFRRDDEYTGGEIGSQALRMRLIHDAIIGLPHAESL